MVGNTLCVYKPWEMGEEFFATDKEGKPTQWDPADIGRILNKYVFNTSNPGIAAQRRREPQPVDTDFETILYEERRRRRLGHAQPARDVTTRSTR